MNGKFLKINAISILCIGLCLVALIGSSICRAGDIDLSGSFSYSQTDFGSGNTQWSRRWSLSFGYTFWNGLSEIELSVEDGFFRTQIANYADTSFHDEVYSIDWLQNLLPRKAGFQPFVKIGAGQLNRTASGSYAGGGAPPAIYDALTGVLGAGLKIYVLKAFAVKGEATTYLPGAVLSTWQQNFSVNIGFSLYL